MHSVQQSALRPACPDVLQVGRIEPARSHGDLVDQPFGRDETDDPGSALRFARASSWVHQRPRFSASNTTNSATAATLTVPGRRRHDRRLASHQRGLGMVALPVLRAVVVARSSAVSRGRVQSVCQCPSSSSRHPAPSTRRHAGHRASPPASVVRRRQKASPRLAIRADRLPMRHRAPAPPAPST